MSYFLLKHFVRRKPYGVADMPCLQVLVNLRLGKSSVCSKQQPHRQLQVALDDGIDELLPAIGAVDVAWSENRPFAISKLVEAEQGVIAYASKVAVVGCFPPARHAPDSPELSMSRMIRLCTVLANARFIHSTFSRSMPLRFSFCVSNSVSNLPISLVLAAFLSGPFQPTTTLRAGSWERRSASLVSSYPARRL